MANIISLGDFYGLDSLIDLLIVFVSFMIFFQSKKIYKIINDKNYKYFSWAFLSVSFAYFFKIINNLTLLYRIDIDADNLLHFLLNQFATLQFINFFSFVLYKIFLLGGFLTLFLIFTKDFKKENIVLFSYMSLIIIIFSIYFNFLFHLTLVLILFFITIYFYRNFKMINSRNSLFVFVSFFMILIGNCVEIFHNIDPLIYLLDEFLLLISFIILLINHLSIKNKNDKKNKT
jgi:hypothetical protein